MRGSNNGSDPVAGVAAAEERGDVKKKRDAHVIKQQHHIIQKLNQRSSKGVKKVKGGTLVPKSASNPSTMSTITAMANT